MSWSNSTVTRLDQMLYAWLAESDDRKFDRAFAKYHVEAFTVLVKYLARRASSVELDFEQIAADALLRFFSKVGRERRAAAESIARVLPRIQEFDIGAFHARQVGRWATEVGSFRTTALAFRVEDLDNANADWRAEIESLADKIPPLQRQGCRLLEPVRGAALLGQPGEAAVELDAFREFVGGLQHASEDSPAALALQQRYPGSLEFVEGTWTVIDSVPLLRVPTNGYLFEMAQSLYLDECKLRGRQKRGGTGSLATDDLHPLARMHQEDEEVPHDAIADTTSILSLADTAADLAGEDFCEKFYRYLRRPLEAAEEAYRIAAASGPAKVERKRLDSVAGKTERITAILTMRIEGQTQEAIAEALDISRNQVKYVIELVQESYGQFAAACMRDRRRTTDVAETTRAD